MTKWSLFRIQFYLGPVKTNHSVTSLWKQMDLNTRCHDGSDLKETEKQTTEKVTTLANLPLRKINPSGLQCLVVIQNDLLLIDCSLNWQASQQKATLNCNVLLVCFIYCSILILGIVSAHRKGSVNICCMFVLTIIIYLCII